MILTKTTAVFLLPSIAWLLWASAAYRIRPFLRIALSASAIGSALWSGYFFLFVRPHFLEDYRYLFSANGYTGITAANALTALGDTVKDGLWLGSVLYLLALAAVAVALLVFRRRIPPLQLSLILWATGYGAFLAYHNNLQPRYYLVLAVPLTLLIPLVLEELLGRLRKPELALRFFVWTALLLVVGLPGAIQTLHYVRTPEYTFVSAASRVRQIVTNASPQSSLILSISGSDLSLMTGLPSICDDFGTMDLPERVATYRPGWYAAWNQVEDDKMEALAPIYHLHRVAEFPVMDDPERNLLILYRLDPTTVPPPPRRKQKPIPYRFRTHFGQQPSINQLEH